MRARCGFPCVNHCAFLASVMKFSSPLSVTAVYPLWFLAPLHTAVVILVFHFLPARLPKLGRFRLVSHLFCVSVVHCFWGRGVDSVDPQALTENLVMYSRSCLLTLTDFPHTISHWLEKGSAPVRWHFWDGREVSSCGPERFCCWRAPCLRFPFLRALTMRIL